MLIEPVALEGHAVRLVPLAPEHLDGLCAVGLHPELWKYAPGRVTDRAAMASYVAAALAEQRAGASLPFAVLQRASGRIIGSTRFCAITVAHRRVEIGWTWLAPDVQRTGANTEQKFLMLHHAFEHWQVHRVELKTSHLNARSRAAIARIGAVEEGTFRRHMINDDGSVRDTVYFAITDLEWPVVRGRLRSLLARPGRV